MVKASAAAPADRTVGIRSLLDFDLHGYHAGPTLGKRSFQYRWIGRASAPCGPSKRILGFG